MVDTNNLPQINSLMTRYTNYRQALDVIDDGGAIVSFSLSGSRGFATVGANDINYPGAMIDAIRDQVRRRLDDLERELDALGVVLNGARR